MALDGAKALFLQAGWNRQVRWRLAAWWPVVFALGLTLISIVLAIVQSRALAVRLMAPVESHARHLADAALVQFERQLDSAFDAIITQVHTNDARPWEPPPGFPSWLDGVFLWQSERLAVLTPPSSKSERVTQLVRSHVAARTDRSIAGPRRKVEFYYDSFNSSPAVLACADLRGESGTVSTVVAHINLDQLRTQLVEPFLSPRSDLELVAAGTKPSSLWSQRLFSVMRYWEIRPTRAFVREQEAAVLGQTLIYLGLTVLALATLLVAMWGLVRVVRREMALTEMKANFVADVSHELKTPLALIRLFGETLQSGRVASEDKRREYYEIIIRESTRLTNLIENILDFARIEAGRKEYNVKPTDVVEVVRKTYESYRPQLEHNGFEHHLTTTTSLPWVEADPDAIAQALINLMNNAMKYSDDERYVAIDVAGDVRRGRDGVLISVHDRGIGIRPDDRAHLFDGFFRARDAHVRGQGGTGLGLALVKHIVEAHHGSLDVESRLVKGSTFRIFLPALESRDSDVKKAKSGEAC